MNPEQARWFGENFAAIVNNVERAIVGKTEAIRLAVTCMLAEGHLLLEDYPGTGKTTLARAIAQSVQGTSSRIQFTPDLLPSDVTGVTIFDQKVGEFEFHQGPIFASIVLADEINRASPKTQSALLEVMEEARVTVDGQSYPVGQPFMVIATQNPIEQAGTYRLPEAQLDRFLMKTTLGYPDRQATMRILASGGSRPRSAALPSVVTSSQVTEMSQLAASVHIESSVLDYIVRLTEATRGAEDVRLGVSVRGGLALVRATRVWAASQGRHFVVPDDVKMLAIACLAHRLILDPEAEFNGVQSVDVMAQILGAVPPPTERQPA
ncbi:MULTISPECIES: AAA family ATPase [Tessaracoccus]|uniref:MoxR family ATPase n=2 Tax=Tessaracoccus TaxID=72763 RepID=A0ABY8PXQ4_9ACTN|nr:MULTISPECIES: MoxR family ATPase [Tessaracoccus]QXT63211.1 MoxR family ATPase [Tessaracoccus palaemonis]WGT46942.1 MoxR family ATPase [Tessaracoccus sp. T21]